MSVTRRDFIKKSAATVAIGLAVPPWLSRMAYAEGAGLAQGGPTAGRSIVVIQLTGGNDGINTVIPYAQSAYRQNRPNLAVAENQILHLDNNIGLNPVMTGMKSLYDKGQLAIVQGVGYPNPNRSHFRSMEIWQTAEPEKFGTEGWLGRYLDAVREGRLSPLTGINIGNEASEAFASPNAHASVPTIQGLANFGFVFPRSGDGDARTAALRQIQMSDTSTHYGNLFAQTAQDTYQSADKIRAGVANYHSNVQYPNDGFGKGLQEVAMLVAANLGTRVFYVSFGGGSFDTHTAQSRRQPVLLKSLSDGLAAFQQDLELMGASDRVMTLAFSEFGRRVHENAGGGTDHGTASEMFIVGKPVKGGLYGAYPSLTDLDQGDLKFTTDFRAVYATMIDRWLSGNSEAVLGKRYEDLKFA